MRTSILAVALASVLLIGAGAGGAFAATSSLQPQQSTTSTGNTTTAGGGAATATSGSSAGTAETAAGSSGPSITFNDQQSSGETVLIQSATLSTNGFIVINGTSGGAEQVIGSSYLLNAGLADNVRIQLNQPLNGSESLTAVLYADANGNGAFDPDADEPVYQGDSDRRIVDIADVTVQDSSSGTATSADSPDTETAASAGGAETTAASGDGGASTQADEGGTASGDGGNASGETTSSNGPGFGPVVAVVALLAVAFLVRRR